MIKRYKLNDGKDICYASGILKSLVENIYNCVNIDLDDLFILKIKYYLDDGSIISQDNYLLTKEVKKD